MSVRGAAAIITSLIAALLVAWAIASVGTQTPVPQRANTEAEIRWMNGTTTKPEQISNGIEAITGDITEL
ncbi:MAG: hypothetical protein ACRDC7_10930, partial [Aeromonas veronii]